MRKPRETFAVDLRRAGFEAWLDAVFDHPPRSDPRDINTAWYWMVLVDFRVDPARQVRYLTKLFERPQVLVTRYTAAQIEEGFWFMFGAAGTEWFLDPLWDAEVPWVAREACIRAVPRLYDGLFPPDGGGDGVAWMLWDLLAFGYDCGNHDPARNEEDRRVQDAMFEALREMLTRSKSPAAQEAALHGLFHLKHAGGPDLIRGYLRLRGVPPWLREYASSVLDGRAL